jgi:protein-disulfide isomerase
MKKKILTTLTLIFVCAGTVFLVRLLVPKESWNTDRRTLARSKGEPHAALWITEYFDYQCPACRTAHDLLDRYIQKYPGRIYLQLKFYPLVAHKYGLKTALYAECAARQNKFWKFHDLLFENQQKWQVLPDAEPVFRDYAKAAALDMRKCDACLKNPETQKTVMEEKGKADAMGVQITPTCYINGKICAGFQEVKQELQSYFGEEAAEKPKTAVTAQ